MRILILNFRDLDHPGAGGAEFFTEEIGRRLVQYGNEVTLFTSEFEGCEPQLNRSGMNIIRQGGKYSVYRRGREFVKQHLSEFDILVDEINTVPFQLSKAAKGSPVMVLIHQLAREVWFHETWFPLSLIGYLALEPFWLKKYRSNPTITVSESTKEDLQEMGFKNVYVVRNGVNATPLNELPSKSDHPVLVFLGRVVSSKHPDHAIKTFLKVRRQFPTAELWVLGDGYLRRKLERRHIDGVTFYGYVSAEEKFDLLKQAHVILCPSVREGWGTSVIEANAMGTPAIGYAVPGLKDSIVDGVTGVLVEPGNIDAMAQATSRILTDSEVAKKLATSALNWSRRFNWDDSAKAFHSFLQSTLNPEAKSG